MSAQGVMVWICGSFIEVVLKARMDGDAMRSCILAGLAIIGSSVRDVWVSIRCRVVATYTPCPAMRSTLLNLEESRIREVANAGMGRSDVLAFWFGESDEVTPDVVRQAAIAS